MTENEFYAVAAEGIMRGHGRDPETVDPDVAALYVEQAIYALRAVGGWQLVTACRSALGTLHNRAEEVCKVVSAELRQALKGAEGKR